ncbi:amidohydrolase [Brevibacillus borstelensis]|uniref:amidohydrolase n=1 Tax=Brevibacillus borstelensis TaxID=45462 RepID=UPI001D0BE266|nr:amidohydrolase [Brevibacillus borstelensis]MCC0564332.1 amidohydrolase [Brevibacillus borstelensis]MCM3472390.1 amidohydrolase [Brevibacillus borstelensis]MCM3559430.1 amidohydrolase [Brevibacillus borstelensis]MCM3622727.1 amidohydrolase [Brevibacillus borstelensis]
MKRTTCFLASLLLLGSLVSYGANAAPLPADKQADLILQNGAVYTVDKNRNWAEAVAVKDGRILFVGTDADAKKYAGPKTEVVDLKGKMVLPGFFDSHTHASETVKQIHSVDLYGKQSVDEYLQAVREFAKKHPDAKVITGMGWSNPLIPGKGPSKKMLDDVISDIPVVLTSEDVHSVWANSKALELAGITKDTKNPEGGVIERDDATGEPWGTLREKAVDLIADVVPEFTVDQYMDGILAYQEMAAERGVTTAHEPMIGGPNVLAAYKKAEENNKLTMRFRNSFLADPGKGPEQLQEFIKEREKNKGPLYQTNSVKIFMDGVIEGSTGYLSEPYEHIDSHGELVWRPDSYKQMAAAIDKSGFQVHVHSIGDAATSIALDGLEAVQKSNGKRDSRHLITHLQLVKPEDISRFKALGVIGVPQPFWFFKEPGYYEDIQVPYLGQERADREYPMKSFIAAGVHMASSSDYPVTQEFSPLDGIERGVTRAEHGSTDPGDILWPEERATLADMIASFTIEGAYANFLENETGSIEIGKKADLVVLEKNLFEIPATQINETKVLLTLFEGKPVYRDSSFGPAGK